VIDRLTDVLMVHALRAHIAAPETAGTSWLAGLADRRIGKVLRSFHTNVDASWTVERLASGAGKSRSSFAAIFASMSECRSWIMWHGGLTETDLPFGGIAARKG
jgi:AraC-like DNA-binding protein